MKTRSLLFLILCPLWVFAKEPTVIKPYQMATFNQEITHIYQIKENKSPDELKRLKSISGYFLGRPYLLYPTGEGMAAEFDKNPMYRTDQFDCLTYVETVLGLVKSNNLKEFTKNLPRIRYHDNQLDFLHRNHFTDLDWNPQNQSNGYIKNITADLFPKEMQEGITLVDKPKWFQQLPVSTLKLIAQPSNEKTQTLLEKLHNLGRKTEKKSVKLTYLPLTALFDKQGHPIQSLFDRIPDGSIIEIVKLEKDLNFLGDDHLLISHVGFGLRMNKVLQFREASQVDKKVEDIPLAKYLKKYLKHPKVKGIHIEQII